MAATPGRKQQPTKNRTIRLPAPLLKRVQVKLAKEDRKFNALVTELLAGWAADEGEDDGLTPGQRFLKLARDIRRRLPKGPPLEVDPEKLMGDR